MSLGLLWFVFFFQAEDGIRDYKVTGVQTCALPIYCEVLSLSSSACTPVPPLDRSPAIAKGLVHRHLVWLIVNAWLGRSPIAIVCATSGFAHVPAPDSLVCAASTCAPRNVSASARKRVRISSSLGVLELEGVVRISTCGRSRDAAEDTSRGASRARIARGAVMALGAAIHFASYPANSPRWYTFPLYSWSRWMPILEV